MVQSARGVVKCSSKECADKEKAEAKLSKTSRSKTSKTTKTKKKSAPVQFDDEFNPPPLMDEPQYFGYEDVGNE